MSDRELSSATRREAENVFMAEKEVVGIAETRSSGYRIVFLLSTDSQRLRKSIERWASDHDVGVEIQIVGGFQLLKTG
jgi:hypothetical protein